MLCSLLLDCLRYGISTSSFLPLASVWRLYPVPVEEDHVEDVVDQRQRLTRIAFHQLGRLLETCFGDVAPPVGDAFVVALQREHAAAEIAHARGEPDRRVATAGADLEHLAVGLRRADGEEEAAGGRLDGDAGRARLLGLEPRENGADAIVEHGRKA